MPRSVKRSINRPHMQVTEAQTLDEALDIIKARQRRKKTKPRMTLKFEFAANKSRQKFKPVSLSDRTMPKQFGNKPKIQLAPIVWSKEQVIEQYNTGMFKIRDLVKMAKVPNSFIIKSWIWGDQWSPQDWYCCGAKIINKPNCPDCGQSWQARYGV